MSSFAMKISIFAAVKPKQQNNLFKSIMRKFFAMALMAFAALVVSSCDSDDSNVLSKALDKVVAVANSKLMSGSMPSATDKVQGLTNNMTQSNGITSILVSSPVELTKFFISAAGLDGYLECPAEAVASAPACRAEASSFSYIVVIALGDGATETVKISVNAETVDGKVVEIVNKMEVVNETGGNSNADVSALRGVWIMSNNDYNTILTITDKTYSIQEDWGNNVVSEKGVYEIKDGYVYLTPSEPDPNSGKIETQKAKIELYSNNNALVFMPFYTYQDNMGNLVEECDEQGFMIFYKKDAKIEMNSKDVQGTWLWLMPTNDDNHVVRVAMIFKDNTFDFIIPVWGERMKGTFTCENGFINFKVSQFLINESRPVGIDEYLNGYEKPQPDSYVTEPPFGMEFSRPFLPVGDFAFSNVANLPCRLTKQ